MNIISSIVNNMTIRERKDGRLEGRISIQGKRKGFYGKTKTEVKNQAKEHLQKVENGYKEPKSIIFNEYMEYWLTTFKENKIESSSYNRLCSVYTHQIHDSIGNKKIGQITTKDIQDLIDSHANPLDPAVKPLALSGLKRILNLLNPCLKKAVEEGVIQKNPCEHVILPKESCILKKTKQQFSLSDKELEEFKVTALSKYKSTKDYRSRDALVLLLMLNLGLRVGDDDDKIRLNQRKPSKYKGLSRFGPEKNLQRINKFMKERPTFYKKLIQMKENFRFYLRCFYCITKVVILQFNSEKQDRISS